MKKIELKIKEVDPRVFKGIIVGIFSSLAVMLTVAGVLFFMMVHPYDETVVPRVVGLPLSEAMLLLQKNDLQAHVVVRFSTDEVEEAHLVVEQTPAFGSRRRVGKEVSLVVTMGLPTEGVIDFTGMNIGQVRDTLITKYGTMLIIREPSEYVTSEHPVGTIIGQDPSFGEKLTGPRQLSLIISRGPLQASSVVTSFIGQPYDEAIRILAESNMPFITTVQGQSDVRRPEILGQQPMAGALLADGDIVQLMMNAPKVESSEKFSLYTVSVPSAPEPILLQVKMRLGVGMSGETILFSSMQNGATLVLPIVAPIGRTLVFLMNGREVSEVLIAES
jgi:beta-lactam-binding protein with PASTA domain